MRISARTSRNTRVSASPITWIVLWLIVLSMPAYFMVMLPWWGRVVVVLVAGVLAVSWLLQRLEDSLAESEVEKE